MVHTRPGKPGKPGKPRKKVIFMKSLGKPGTLREFRLIFIQVRENSEKSNYPVHV